MLNVVSLKEKEKTKGKIKVLFVTGEEEIIDCDGVGFTQDVSVPFLLVFKGNEEEPSQLIKANEVKRVIILND